MSRGGWWVLVTRSKLFLIHSLKNSRLWFANWLFNWSWLIGWLTYYWMSEPTSGRMNWRMINWLIHGLICLYNHSVWLIIYIGITKIPDWWDSSIPFIVFSYVGAINNSHSHFSLGSLRRVMDWFVGTRIMVCNYGLVTISSTAMNSFAKYLRSVCHRNDGQFCYRAVKIFQVYKSEGCTSTDVRLLFVWTLYITYLFIYLIIFHISTFKVIQLGYARNDN